MVSTHQQQADQRLIGVTLLLALLIPCMIFNQSSLRMKQIRDLIQYLAKRVALPPRRPSLCPPPQRALSINMMEQVDSLRVNKVVAAAEDMIPLAE